MRQLKYHEKKLLKKVDFFNWKEDQNVREGTIIRRYHLQNREDYVKYIVSCWTDHKTYRQIKKLEERR